MDEREHCKRCDGVIFVIVYDPKMQARHVECFHCGEVFFL